MRDDVGDQTVDLGDIRERLARIESGNEARGERFARMEGSMTAMDLKLDKVVVEVREMVLGVQWSYRIGKAVWAIGGALVAGGSWALAHWLPPK